MILSKDELRRAISSNTFQDFLCESTLALFCSQEILFLADVHDRACMTRTFGANSALGVLSDTFLRAMFSRPAFLLIRLSAFNVPR